MKKGATRKSRPKTKNAHTHLLPYSHARTHTPPILVTVFVCVSPIILNVCITWQPSLNTEKVYSEFKVTIEYYSTLNSSD